MSIGVTGRKLGMSRIFIDSGRSIPVTVISVEPNRITQIKSADGSDGYDAMQITVGERRKNRVSAPMAGHFSKAGSGAGRGLWEFRLTKEERESLSVGQTLEATRFEAGQTVDVIGISRGCGFQGVVKRHNFRMQDATHGNSLSHRAPGSIGQCQTPGRVFKGKKMAGQMGTVRRTVQNLEVVRVDAERQLILLKGAVPGAKGGDVLIRRAVKGKNL